MWRSIKNGKGRGATSKKTRFVLDKCLHILMKIFSLSLLFLVTDNFLAVLNKVPSSWTLQNRTDYISSAVSVVRPTTCTNVSNLFYFGITLYMFRTVFPSVIRSSRLYIQQQAFVKQILLSACRQTDSSICLTNACCCMYSLEFLMMDRGTFRNM